MLRFFKKIGSFKAKKKNYDNIYDSLIQSKYQISQKEKYIFQLNRHQRQLFSNTNKNDKNEDNVDKSNEKVINNNENEINNNEKIQNEVKFENSDDKNVSDGIKNKTNKKQIIYEDVKHKSIFGYLMQNTNEDVNHVKYLNDNLYKLNERKYLSKRFGYTYESVYGSKLGISLKKGIGHIWNMGQPFNIFSIKNKENFIKSNLFNLNNIDYLKKNSIKKEKFSRGKELYDYMNRSRFYRNFNRIRLNSLIVNLIIFGIFFYLCFGNFKKIAGKTLSYFR